MRLGREGCLMSSPDPTADDLELPVKRTDGDSLEDRLTDNAYHNILPARYLRRDEQGELAETPEELFVRVSQNVALAETVFEAARRDETVLVSPSQLKPNHPRREELAREVFGDETGVDDDVQTALTEENVNRFAFETVVPELPTELREHVQDVETEFREMMETLSFVPNSPTLMNAGDELQQLSACFVDSPADDLTDIHQTAKEAAEVFQCLTADATIDVADKGLVSVEEVEVGDRVAQATDAGFRYQPVEEVHKYDEAPTMTVELANGQTVRGTPNHRIMVDGEWTRLDTIRAGQKVTYALGWLRGTEREAPALTSVPSGAQWEATRTMQSTGMATELAVAQSAGGRSRAGEQLQPDDTLAETVRQPETLTEELAELVGLWLGDGSWHTDGIRIHVGRESVAEYIDELSRRLFGTPTSVSDADGCYEVGIHSHEIRRWWTENFDCKQDGASSAEVPRAVKRAPAQVIQAFLRGYFTADGTLLNDTYPKLSSSSERAIDDIATLMLGLGYPVEKTIISEEDTHPQFGLIPTTGAARQRFLQAVGFIDERNETALSSFDSVRPRDDGEMGERYDVTVEAVTASDPAPVYDITVADDHEYVTDGIVSHNSGGGMGYAFWQLRPYGDAVGSTGGIASGPITFMRTFDQMCETIAQGGTRRGAQMAVMRVSHPDVIEFIHAKNKDVSLAHSLRLNDPDDYTYTTFGEALEEARGLIDEDGRVPEHLRNAVEGHLSNFNISVGITDRFMEALDSGGEFGFENPRTGEPHIATEETREMYARYGLAEHVEPGEEFSIPAEVLWDRMVDGAYENGEPGVIYLERVNKQHSFDVEKHPDHRILATNPCVTGETLISTENGLTAAEDLYEQGVAQNVTVDGRLSEEPLKEASSVYKTGEKDVYKLTTEEGYEIRLTADHRVMTDSGWTKAEDLDAGDRVHVQNRKGSFGQHGTAAAGRVLGWMVGDGHLETGEERAVLNFHEEAAELSESFAADVDDIVRNPVGDADSEIGISERSRGAHRGAHAIEQRVRSARLYEYAKEAGLVDRKQQVPDSVLRGSEQMARGYLRGLFSANGGVQKSTQQGVSVRLASTSTDLLQEVQRLLLNFGIFSSICDERQEAAPREMPDGTGGTAASESQADHALVISKDDLTRFSEEIGFLLDSKQAALEEQLGTHDRGACGERFQATVSVVEGDGHEAVYDLTEPETSSFIGNGLVVHNCGEQPLEEYEACNLGHINLSTLAADHSPDWRVWSADQAEEFDSTEAAVEAFLQEAVDFEEFDHRIQWGTRFLENVVTMSDFPVEKIEQKVREMRKIGLGIMGLAQLYIQLGIRYGSPAGNEVARQLMTHINHRSKQASHGLATERGSFAEWDASKFADPTAYTEWFEHHTGEVAADWADGYPIRNHNTTTIAPTGTTSMVGNTSGGCEPIFSVAYFKNVSDDVQGDEMLVEFDDYFLRILEANDIDVEAVQAEATEQMQNNEFDGIEGLDRVPDAIAELFVVTADLSGIEHAAVQCACQEGVDSAISKTCNFPNAATKADMDEVYRYIYENGGKGVTVYRDGTRSKQVLTTRADNTEFSAMDEDEAAAQLLEHIDQAFDDIERFLDHDAVRAEHGDVIDQLSGDATPDYADKQPRPDVLRGVTQRIDTGYGRVYITINEDVDAGQPFELFANTGMSGGFTSSFTEALAKSISISLRSGVDPSEIADKLRGIRSPKVAWDKGEQINSIPDAFGVALRRYLDEEIDQPYPRQQSLSEVEDSDEEAETAAPETAPVTETDGGDLAQQPSEGNPDMASPTAETDATQSLIDAGESPECPDCGAMTIYFSEGCKTCESCGWSEC